VSPSTPSVEAAVAPASGAGDFIRVSDARARYFGGAMSLRWWYRQIERGALPHYRAGGAVLLRPADVEAFVGAGFRPTGRAAPEAAAPAAPPPKPRPSAPVPGGLRFFGG
jgi:hypothetical protein